MHRPAGAVDHLEAGERAVEVDDGGVLVAIAEVAEVDLLGEHLVAQVDVVEAQPARLGGGRIGALVVLEPAQRGVAFVRLAAGFG